MSDAARKTKHAYICMRCGTIYDPSSQGYCSGCMHHPHLGDDCDHDCDGCDSVRFPPKNGHLDLFELTGMLTWRRVPRKTS